MNKCKKYKWLLLVFVCFVALVCPMQVKAASKTKVNKSITLCVDEKKSITKTGLSGTIKWSTSNKKIATVSSKGKVTAKKTGKALITAKSKKKTYTVSVKVVKHNWKKTKTVKPTCESKGYTTYTCTKNKKHTKVTNLVKAKGHQYKTWKTVKKATCVVAGYKTSTCTVCGDVSIKEIPVVAHQYVNDVCKVCHAKKKLSTANELTVKVTKDKIYVHINGVGKVKDGYATLVRMNAYEYAKGDSLSGLVNKVSSGTQIAYYGLGTDTTLTFDRYDELETDHLYDKYYLISKKGTILKGPIYANDITPERKVEKFTANTKKGLLGEDIQYVKDTGSKYTAINLNLPNMIYANEDENGIAIDNVKRNTYSYEFQGDTYFFNRGYVDSIDKQIKEYTDSDIGVTLILVAWNSSTWNWRADYPSALLYKGGSDKGTIVGVNTSNELGAKYWMATVEFLAERYSRSNNKYGRINNVVLGNEIDYAYDYNNIAAKATSLDVYMEEYSRLLRLTQLALSKYMDNVVITVPTTHDWMRAEYYNTYKPKEIYDWLNKKTKAEGDFNWGLSPHCYPMSLANSYGIEDDTINGRKMYNYTDDYNTSDFLSFSNLEILQAYLEQPQMKYNGQLRDVYLTESGCSSYLNREGDLRRQAAYVATAYYKAAILDCIDAFIYYRAIDHSAETVNGMSAGIVDSEGNKKYAYDVWKYADTQYSFRVANQYLDAAAFYDAGVKNVPGKNSNDMDPKETVKYRHSVANGNVSSYKDMMYAFSDKLDWNKLWDETKIIRRTIESIPKWDDKIDLDGVYFYGKSYMYDGNEHELLVTGTLPEGVSVTYENNKRTEKGSQEAIAKFYKNGEVVATRKATIYVGNMITNRSVYENGEKIFVTVNAESTDQWIGIYRKGDVVGDVKDGGIPSVYWYYVNNGTQVSGNTYAIQDIGEYNNNRPELKNLPAGDYEIVLMGKNGTYEIDETISITILNSGDKSGLPRLDGIKYQSKSVAYNGTEQALEISGTLPEGVTVKYSNNKLIQEGRTQATAHFMYQGQELETRTATFTVNPGVKKTVTTNKTTYQVGEDILVTAIGSDEDWVGIYKKDDIIGDVGQGGIQSVYWYYVCKNGNESGKAVNIKNTDANTGRVDWDEVKDLPAGEYKIVLLGSGADVYTTIASTNITIEDAPSKKLQTSKTTYKMGEEVSVTANADGKDAWVGIYAKDDPTDGSVQSIYWYYVNDDSHQSGKAYKTSEMNDDNCKKSRPRALLRYLPVGEYKVVLTPEDGSYGVEEQVDFTVEESKEIEDKMQLVSETNEFAPGATIELKTSAYTTSGKDWVALFAEGVDYSQDGENYLGYAYVKEGTTTLTAPTQTGKYTIVFLGEDARHMVKKLDIVVK